MIALSDHAVDRFRERVRPDLEHGPARAVLSMLAREAGEPTWDRPWASLRSGRRYLVVAFGVALAIDEPRRGKRLVATTCVTNDAFRVVRA